MKTAEDFWSYVKTGHTSDCWEWQRARVTDIYGKKTYGVLYLAKVRWYAHQLSYTLTYGDIPQGMCVCHTCDNPPCCNPSHLFLGTQGDNTGDRVKKGRTSRHLGTSNGLNVLTEQQVLDIKTEHATGKAGYKKLGKKYGVHNQTISNIIKGKTWVWLHKQLTEDELHEVVSTMTREELDKVSLSDLIIDE